MSRVHKLLNLVGVGFPFLAFVVAIVLLWNTWVDWSDLAVLAIMYVLTGYGVTLGFHRLLTHRSFQTFEPVEYTLAALGSMAVQGPVMSWVADHRKVDPTAWGVRGMKRVKLAWNVVEITPERQRQKLV